MTIKLAKWMRKIHRWIAVPTAIAIPATLIIKALGDSDTGTVLEKIDRVPSIMMLFMAATGVYLFILPYIIRRRRK